LLREHRERHAPVLRLDDVEAFVGQHPAERGPDLRLVIHH
jgi:hypothetical protein